MTFLKRASVVLMVIALCQTVVLAQHTQAQADTKRATAVGDANSAVIASTAVSVAVDALNTDLANFHSSPKPYWYSYQSGMYSTMVSTFMADWGEAIMFQNNGTSYLIAGNNAMSQGDAAYMGGDYETAWQRYNLADVMYTSATGAYNSSYLEYIVADTDCRDCNSYYNSN